MRTVNSVMSVSASDAMLTGYYKDEMDTVYESDSNDDTLAEADSVLTKSESDGSDSVLTAWNSYMSTKSCS